MEIKYEKFAASEYKLEICEESENCLYGNEKVLIPLKDKQITPQETLVNVASSDNDKIYLKLADCEDTNSIINFCQKYGTLINPFSYDTGESRHSFGVVKELLEETLNQKINAKRNLIQKDYLISLTHFRIYQREMKMLIDIIKFLSVENSHDDTVKFVDNCKKFFKEDSFYDLICLEYSNAEDDMDDAVFKSTPLSLARFLMSKSEHIKKEDLYEILEENKVEDSIAKCFLNMLCPNENDNFNYDLEWSTIQKTAKQISVDFLRFHLHDSCPNPLLDAQEMVTSSSEPITETPSSELIITFPSLASAIFYYLYFDFTGPMTYRKCVNPGCNNGFFCHKNSPKIYCSDNCGNIVRNERYRARKNV